MGWTKETTLGASAGSGGSASVADALKADIQVTFDAASNGTNGVNQASYTWNHTATSGAYVIVALGFSVAQTPTVTYGGVSMTALYSGTGGHVFGLANVAGGTKAIVVTPSNSLSWFAGCSSSYSGVSSVGSVTTATGTGTTASSGSVTAPTNGLMVVGFGSGPSGSGWSYSSTSGGTNRARQPGGLSGSAAISDTAGNDTLTAKLSTSVPWSAVRIPLNGAAGTVSVTGGSPGSVIFAKTATSYAATSQGTAGQMLVSGGAGAPTWQNQPTDTVTLNGVQSVKNKTFDSTNTFPVLSPSSVGASWFPPGYLSGNYYYCNSASTQGAGALSANAVRVTPWVVTNPITITRLFAEFTVAGDANSLMRIGIWNHDTAANRPGSLLLEAGSISTGTGNAGTVATNGTPGVYELVVSQQLSPGLYWIGGVTQGVTSTAPTIRTVVASSIPMLMPCGTSLPTSTQVQVAGWYLNGVTGALGSLASALPGGASSPPRIGFKVA